MTGFAATILENWPDWWPELLAALWVTLALTGCGLALGLAVGLLLAVGRRSGVRALRAFCRGYVELARGVPTVAILYLLYFGLLPAGIALDPFTAGWLGLGLSAGGYLAEVFRAGIEATPKGQREAALAVGMTPRAAFRWVVLPQAFRIVLPPLVNTAIGLLKDSSLCALITAPELMLRARDLATIYFLPLHIYVVVGLFYLAVAWPFSLLARWLERRLHAA